MESSSSSSSNFLSLSSLSSVDYLTLLILRPALAITFVLSLLFLGWFLAWKLVLVHVPLVQEVFGLKKKPVKSKPENRGRLTRFYNSINPRTPSSSS